MEAILSESVFTDFGSDPLYPYSDLQLKRVSADNADELRRLVRLQAPRHPGVYGMIDCLGRLIYVGKSKLLRNRLLSYFFPGNNEDKSGRIMQATKAIVWETQPTDFAALLREQSLIRKFQPRLNVQGIPRRQQKVYICLGRSPAEQLYVSRRADPSASATLGPLNGASRANRVVEVLNRYFQLRDCSSKQACQFTDQMQLFQIDLRPGCIRLEIGNCLGPCIAACSKNQYTQQAEAARNFLTGQDDSAVGYLEKLMRQAARFQHFEQAARLREDIKVVRWLAQRASDILNARQRFSFIYPANPADPAFGKPVWYFIRHGMIEGAIAAPQNKRQLPDAQRAVQQWWSDRDRASSPYKSRPETLALVASWFRTHPRELKQTLDPAKCEHVANMPIHRATARVAAS